MGCFADYKKITTSATKLLNETINHNAQCSYVHTVKV